MIFYILLLTVLPVGGTIFPDVLVPAEWNPTSCPNSCSCDVSYSEIFKASLRTVNCAHRELTAVPTDLPQDAQILDLKGNLLTTVQDLKLWNPNLLELDLSDNRIKSLGRVTIFEGLYNLRRLSLKGNRIGHLQDNIFQGLFNLEDLDLSSNRLSAIRNDAFQGLSKLEALRLSENKITFIQQAWWKGVSSIYELHLNRNHLRMIQADSFSPLNSLLSLDLSNNQIFRLNHNAFQGLDRLEYLHLAKNNLAGFPKHALGILAGSLKSLSLSHNPIPMLARGDIGEFAALKDVSFTSMQRLRVIEGGAFRNLPQLLVVDIHDNPFLGYFDAGAFVNAPLVSHLLLHNNNLTTLDHGLADSLPQLQEISFYGNPLACDCNAHWLRETVARQGRSTVIFREAERMVCDAPENMRFKLLSALDDGEIPLTCTPRIVSLQNTNITAKFGEDLTVNCYAFGVPAPQISWILPNGQRVPGTSDLYTLLNGGSTLMLKRVTEEESGNYRCIADNGIGKTERSVNVKVVGLEVDLFLEPNRVGSTWVTLRWRGGDRAQNIFQILYRPDTPHARHQYAGTVTPIMSHYTISNLQPNTQYEACLAFEDSHHVVVHISCVKFLTKNLDFLVSGIERTSNVAVGIALGVVACMLIIICLAAVAFKRGAKRQSNIYYDNLSQLENSPSLESQVFTAACVVTSPPRTPERHFSPLISHPIYCTHKKDSLLQSESAKLERLLHGPDA